MRIVTGAMLFTFLVGAQGSPGTVGVRPNFIVIRIDDARADDMQARRPDGSLVLRSVQSLITSNGMTFTNHFAPLSLCCPSRASFYSGQYAHNNNVYGNTPPFGGAGRFDNTNALAVWMQTSGYYTGHIGKYMNGHDGSVLPGWDWWQTRNDQTGQGYYYGYHLNDNGADVSYGYSIRDYATDVFTQKALRFLSDGPFGTKPFFLVLDYTAPHDVPTPAVRHQNIFADTTFQWPPSFDEEDVSDKPPGVQQMPRLSQETIDGITAAHRARLGCLLAVDEGVGQIMHSLREHGLSDSTYVLFLSDNGYLEGEHRMPGGKNIAYEESVRVPLVISGPGIRRASCSDQLVANIDMVPTILDLAGATSGRVMDGLSLTPTFRGESIGRERLLIEGYHTTPPFVLRRTYAGLRTPDYVYIETDENGNGVFDQGIDAQELYTIHGDAYYDADPYELESRHSDPIYSSLMEQLHQRLLTLEGCSGTTCR